MAEILELIVVFLASIIYGSEGSPRHPIWRNLIRFIAFSGAVVSVFSLLGLLGKYDFPIVVVAVWSICSLIIISAEYYVGSKKVAFAALTASAVWFLVVLITLDTL